MTGWWLTYPSEKYAFISWDYSSQYMEKKTCSKPPTRWYNGIYHRYSDLIFGPTWLLMSTIGLVAGIFHGLIANNIPGYSVILWHIMGSTMIYYQSDTWVCPEIRKLIDSTNTKWIATASNFIWSWVCLKMGSVENCPWNGENEDYHLATHKRQPPKE